jgi:hypothetical protein
MMHPIVHSDIAVVIKNRQHKQINCVCVFYNKITLSITYFDCTDQHQVKSDARCCHSEPPIPHNSEIR